MVEQLLLRTGDLNLLQEMPFLILLDRYGQFSMDLSKIFDEYQFDPLISFRFETGELIDKFCLKGYGCMLATQSYIKSKLLHYPSSSAKSILCYPIQISCFEPKIAISYAKHKNLRSIEKAFLNEALNYFEHL